MYAPATKTCSRCGLPRPYSDFGQRKEGSGVRSRCRQCEADAERARRRANPDLYREQAKKRRAEGGADREREAKRRRKKEDFFGYHQQFARRFNRAISADDLRSLWERQNGLCGLTGQPMDAVAGRVSLDHIVPQARGGSHEMSNLRWVTKEANLAKRDLLDEEFLELCENVAEWLGERIMQEVAA